MPHRTSLILLAPPISLPRDPNHPSCVRPEPPSSCHRVRLLVPRAASGCYCRSAGRLLLASRLLLLPFCCCCSLLLQPRAAHSTPAVLLAGCCCCCCSTWNFYSMLVVLFIGHKKSLMIFSGPKLVKLTNGLSNWTKSRKIISVLGKIPYFYQSL